MLYKKSLYQVNQRIAPNFVLCSSTRTKCHILLDNSVFVKYLKGDLLTFSKEYPEVYSRLIDGGFIIESSRNELEEILSDFEEERGSSEMYHLIINPTLDCNLSCWYCYESKMKNSCMPSSIIDGVCKNIESQYQKAPFSLLKISFFGGEPFMKKDVIRKIVSFSEEFCNSKQLSLLLDFTTNGTLCSKEMISFLSNYTCMFQITLDGNKEKHNKVKFAANKHFDAFTTTNNNIKEILEKIPNSFIAVRINFDEETLQDFDDILQVLLPLDRKRTKIILKKVWQVNSSAVSHIEISKVMEKLFENRFVVDYYSQGGVCFADRKNEAVINFDGRIFKCTTINQFNSENSLGEIDAFSGDIKWKWNELKSIEKYKSPEKCLLCKLYPSCGGPCKKKCSNLRGWNCFLDTINMNIEEYVLTQFEIEYIKDTVYGVK